MLFVSMLCEPDDPAHAVCAASSVGVDDSRWLRSRLAEQGLAERVEVFTVNVAAGEPLPEDVRAFQAVVLGGTFHGEPSNSYSY